MHLSRTATILFLMLASCTRDPGDGTVGKRPESLPSTWPQFSVDGWHDPRVVTINRAGAGPARRAEYYVFELVDEGHRLRRLHQHTLKNEYAPWIPRSLGGGRFLVTLGELPDGGLTENCLVIYDFVRNASVAWRLEDFLAEDIRNKLRHLVMEGMGWFGGREGFDTERLCYYPNSPDDCRECGYPFLVVDLRSLSVQVAPIPDQLGPGAETDFFGQTGWRWSMGDAGGEPGWSVPSLLPTYLLAVVDPKQTRMDLLAGLCLVEGEQSPVINNSGETVHGWQTCFKLDAATGDYVRCPISEWVERSSEEPEKR